MSNPLSLCITVTVFLLFGAASGRAQDLHHDLAALAKLRDGTAKPLARVDQHGAELLAQYTDEKSQGEIYYLLAHIHAQSGQAQPRKTVEYAKNGLDYPLSPDQRMRLYVYAGDARSLSAFDDNEPFENARRAAAAFYLRGLKEIQSNHQLPDRLPVRPPPSAEDRQMSPDHPNFREWLQRQREESKKYEVDPLVKTMFEHRKVLMGQLVYLYSRRPYASGELRDLASNSLGDDNPAAKLMDQLDVKLASIPGAREIGDEIEVDGPGWSRHLLYWILPGLLVCAAALALILRRRKKALLPGPAQTTQHAPKTQQGPAVPPSNRADVTSGTERNRPAFTLLELLVVLAVLGVLLAITIPAIQKVRAAAAKAQCANNLKQITLACHAFHDDHKRMPPAFGFFPRANVLQGGNALGNLFFHLLPYVEQQALYEASRHQPTVAGKKHDYYFYTANNVHQRQVSLFNCPADPTLMSGINPITNYAPSSYAANYLVFGVVYPDVKKGSGAGGQGSGKPIPFSNKNAQGRPVLPTTFQDGVGNTIVFAEKYASAWLAKTGTGPGNAGGQSPISRQGGCHWAYFQATCHNPFFAYYDPVPKNNPITDPSAVGSHGSGISFQVQPNPQGGCNPCLPATGHHAMNAAMADGSVRSLTAGIERKVWWALVTPAGRDRAE